MAASEQGGGQSVFRELDALIAQARERHQQFRTVCRESKMFRVPKPLSSGGFRLRTTSRFNTAHRSDAVDECFHGLDGFEKARACVAALLKKYPVPAPASKGGVE